MTSRRCRSARAIPISACGTSDCQADFCLHRHEDAVQEINKAMDLGYRTILSYANLAADSAVLHGDKEAKSAMAEATKLNRKLLIAWCRAHLPGWIDFPPDFPDALRKAGQPEE